MSGFWVYMFIISLLMPLTMIFFGGKFGKAAPENINSFYGYRTAMSMKNRDTWVFAHRHMGRLWKKGGIVLLILSVPAMLIPMGSDTETIGLYGLVVVGVQLVVMLVPIFMTEAALKRNFDKYGRRRRH